MSNSALQLLRTQGAWSGRGWSWHPWAPLSGLKEFLITFAGAVQVRNRAQYLPSSNVIQLVHRARCVNSQ